MIKVGWAMIGAGLVVMAIGFGSFSVVAPGAVGEFGPVANIDLIGQREMVFMSGGFLFVAGWIALAAGYIRDALEDLMKPPPRDEIGSGQP